MSERPWIWFYRPQWYWYGWRTLVPVYFGGDEYDRPTVMVGWTVTGRVVVPIGDPKSEVPT